MYELDYERAEELAAKRWPNGFSCPCGGTRAVHLTSKPRVWRCAACAADHSVTAGTILERTRLPLEYWRVAIECHGLRLGISARQLALRLGTRVDTAWQLLHRLRAAIGVDAERLEGNCEQWTEVVRCKRPRTALAAEVAGVVDETGRARIVAGTPRIDRELGLIQLEDLIGRFNAANRGGPRCDEPPPTVADPAVRGTLFEPDARLAVGENWEPAERLCSHFLARLGLTYRGVAARYLQRYANASAFLYQRWPHAMFDATPEGAADEILSRVLAHPPRTFPDLKPTWPPPKGKMVARSPPR